MHAISVAYPDRHAHFSRAEESAHIHDIDSKESCFRDSERLRAGLMNVMAITNTRAPRPAVPKLVSGKMQR